MKKLFLLLPLFFAIATSSSAHAATTNISGIPYACGPDRSSQYLRCFTYGTTNGYMSFSFGPTITTPYVSFVDVGTINLTGLTSSLTYTVTEVPGSAGPYGTGSFIINISNFSGKDAAGNPFTGSGVIEYQTYMVIRGSGKGGGGVGLHAELISANFTINN